jgi:outer membrane immunogenic protein
MRVWTGTIAALLLGTPVAALAADLPVKAPPPVVVYNWTGFYVGGNGGYSWGRASTTQTDQLDTPGFVRAFNPAGVEITTIPGLAQTFPQTFLVPPTTGATSASSKVNGFVGGAQIGYNWQVDRSWVLGFETDFQWSGERGSVNVCSAGCVLGASAIGIANTSLNWFGTARGRVGFLATQTLMVYATGGLAYGRINNDYASGINQVGDPLATGSIRSTRLGWTAGAGVEGKIDQHWSWKAEYLYMDLGSVSTTLTPATATATGPLIPTRDNFIQASVVSTNSAQVATRFTDSIFRFGINYRFDAGPVVARY